MEEVWVRVSGYENYYEVSNFGRVKSYHRYKEGKLLKFNKNHFGYLSVALIKNGQVKLTQVNHIDEDVTNNRVDNLEWCTASYNINYGTRNLKMARTQSTPVLQYTRDFKLIKEWGSIKEAAEYLGISKNGRGHITECCKGRRNKAYGYIWKYANSK